MTFSTVAVSSCTAPAWSVAPSASAVALSASCPAPASTWSEASSICISVSLNLSVICSMLSFNPAKSPANNSGSFNFAIKLPSASALTSSLISKIIWLKSLAIYFIATARSLTSSLVPGSGNSEDKSPFANFFILSDTAFNPCEIWPAIIFPILIETTITEAIIIIITIIIIIVRTLRLVSRLLPASTFTSIRFVRSP